MSSFWEKVEHYNSKLIAPALILLLAIIIYDLFIHSENHTLELIVKIADYMVIAVFVIDLIFLAKHARNAKVFFKNYWLDIIAVFPFAIFFSLVESISRIVIATRELTLGQAILHETVEVSKGTKVLSSGSKFARILKILARSLKLITKSRLFTKIHHNRRKRNSKGRR